MDIIFYKKPSILGAVNGIITGLVAITPGAGVVTGWGAIIFGLCSGSIPWVSFNIAGRKWSLFKYHIDDCLGITHTHMVTGFLGGFLVGKYSSYGCRCASSNKRFQDFLQMQMAAQLSVFPMLVVQKTAMADKFGYRSWVDCSSSAGIWSGHPSSCSSSNTFAAFRCV